MSYEIAGRRTGLFSWVDHWRANDEARRSNARNSKNGTPSFLSNWLASLSSTNTDETDDADELISHTLAVRHLRESLEQLPSHERQVLLLHVNNGLTYWEIAARLGIAEEVVLRDLAHAYSQLRLELSMDELRR